MIEKAPLFLDIADVVNRMQVNPELDGVNITLASAIFGAQKHIESVLDSQLMRQVTTSLFFLDSESFSSMQPGGVFRLELPSGFVRSDVPATITYGSDWLLSDAQSLDPTWVKIDCTRGIVFIRAADMKDKYVQIVCTSGFTPAIPDTDPPTPPEDLPGWLAEAIMAYVPVIFDVSQTSNRNAEASDQYKRAGDHAIAVCSPYLRRKGLAFRPISLS